MNVLDMTIIRLAAGLVLLMENGTRRSSATAASRVQLWQRRWSRSTSPDTLTPI